MNNIKKINNNGMICPSEQVNISIDNRAFRYGDAVFESIAMFKGEMKLWPYHYERLLQGMKALRFSIPEHYSADFFKQEIEKLVAKNTNSRIRLSVYRDDGGLYTPLHNHPKFIIQYTENQDFEYKINKTGLKVSFYDEAPILSKTRLAGIKSANALNYVLAAIHKKQFAYDDCILFNEKGAICEAISSNIFLIKNNNLITADLLAGCVAGVMRRAILEIAKIKHIKIKKCVNLSPKDVFEADAIFLTNAVQGIRWVAAVDHSQFAPHPMIEDLLDYINDFRCL